MTNSKDFTRPLYAAAGAGDLALSTLRRIPDEYQRVQEQLRTVDPAELRTKVEDATGKAFDAYGGLVDRGERLLGRLRRQRATTDLVEQIEETVTRAKSTRTSAKSTRTRAAKTATSAGASATKAGRAARSGAGKVG